MLYSIGIYAATFAVSILGIHGYQKNIERKKKEDRHRRLRIQLENFIWILMILLPPVLIATFRAENVGTDYMSYQRIFNDIKRYGLKEYIQYKGHITYDIEYGYWFICRMVYRLNGGFVWVNFISEFLIIFFIWRGLVWFHKSYGISMALGLFLFYMIEYAFGLNGIRFSIAIAINFYAMRFLLDKKPVLYVLVSLLAVLFHTITVVALLFYAVNIFNNKTMKKFALAAMLILLFLILVEMSDIIKLIKNLTFLGKYFNNYEINEKVRYGWGIWIFVVPMLLPLIAFWKKVRNKSEKLQVLFILTFLYVPFRFLGYYNVWLSRIMRFAEQYICVAVPCLITVVHNKNNKKILEFYYICIALFWYIYSYVILNTSDTYPFEWIQLGGL